MLIEVHTKDHHQRVLLSIKPNAFSVSLNDEEVYSFDPEGRLLTAWVNEQTYVRTLDNRVVKKWREPGHAAPWKQIRELSTEEKRPFLNQTQVRMRRLAQMTGDQVPTEAARVWLRKAAGWSFLRLERERERFVAVYTPVTILPPDQYYALVLQATEGCHWNRCTFCHFYRHSRFGIKSDEEFARHIAAVKDFFGQAIRLRRTIFLGDANALVIPQDRLLRMFDQINREFALAAARPVAPDAGERPVVQGIYSFIDAFSSEKKSVADFQALRDRNLRRVYVGVETGCDELLQFLNKPATSNQVLDAVATIKHAGVSVGIIVLIGVGGDRYDQSHVEQTVALLNALRLDAEDIVYLSPFVEMPDSEYSQRAAQAHIRSLTPREQQEQLHAIRSGLRLDDNHKPRVSLYDIREFVY